MKKLLENLGFYCCRYLDSNSISFLTKYLNSLGIRINNTGFKYHCTTSFSSKFPNNFKYNSNEIKVSLKRFSIFGDYLVIEVESDELNKDFNNWISLGCDYSFKDYKPHISILKYPERLLGKQKLQKILNSNIKNIDLLLTQEKPDLSL